MMLKEINQLVIQIETHIECWKQFNHFISVARAKKFGPADESHFLEIKSVIAQEIELIFAVHRSPSRPRKDEIIALIGHAPSLRHLSEMGEGALRGIEIQWHKIYIGWHSILGQLKVKQQSAKHRSWRRKNKPARPVLASAAVSRHCYACHNATGNLMLNYFQILILALIQGACELLPVSSSAHVIAAEKIMGLDPSSPEMTMLLVMLHTGTMFAVIVYFWNGWRRDYFTIAPDSSNGSPSRSSSPPSAPASSATD